RVRLLPQPPAHWPFFKVSNLRVGDSRFDLEMDKGEKVIWTLKLTQGKPLDVVFQVREDSDWPLEQIRILSGSGDVSGSTVSGTLRSEMKIEITYRSMPKKTFTLVPAVYGQAAEK
ncbi:MAG TPA: hypothetical protein PKN04_16880, partial [bacterium]|nr:hypothetical protein [bacterium]